MDLLPLGDYEQFGKWSGQSRTWGPEGAGWRAWFGGKVVDGLCEILDRHLSAERLSREAQPVAIGCVPWLTSDEVMDKLLRLGACCIVLDKGARLPTRLVTHDRPFPSSVLPRLEMTMPAVDGNATVLGPYSPIPEHALGPVRVLGWRQDKDRIKPLLHAKMLVLGDLGFSTYSPDGAPDFEKLEFTPQSVWWGSANWTQGSRTHLEVGFWSDDESLTQDASSFVQDVISFSEPVDSLTAGPEPNLVPVEFDDEAMWEAWEVDRLDHLATEEDGDPDIDGPV